jgi:HAD superfamily hydrolase (TIGR01456 family)
MKKAKRVALDIDGVILKGGLVIEGAVSGINKLLHHKIPFVFVTNGGGISEKEKAKDLSKKLHVKIHHEQILLSHTPMRDLASTFKSSQVLVIGHQKCVSVAKGYGFDRAISSNCVLKENPLVFPNERLLSSKPTIYNDKEPIVAAMVFHDPVDWALDMQVLSDILAHPHYSNNEPARLYACNADLVYPTEYHTPRFTQGAFLESFKHLYELYHKKPLNYTCFGKPFKIQYEYAERMLQDESNRMSGSNADSPHEVDTIYFGVGDNPLSDIRGANNAGKNWRSILVRTGVFKGGANDPTDPADMVVEDVQQAIDRIIEYQE